MSLFFSTIWLASFTSFSSSLETSFFSTSCGTMSVTEVCRSWMNAVRNKWNRSSRLSMNSEYVLILSSEASFVSDSKFSSAIRENAEHSAREVVHSSWRISGSAQSRMSGSCAALFVCTPWNLAWMSFTTSNDGLSSELSLP